MQYLSLLSHTGTRRQATPPPVNEEIFIIAIIASSSTFIERRTLHTAISTYLPAACFLFVVQETKSPEANSIPQTIGPLSRGLRLENNVDMTCSVEEEH
jgi:hypothetical protein